MDSFEDDAWLVIDGYEDEPAAFGVPPYIGFHIRYLCGVLESMGIPYNFFTIDAWRRLKHQESSTHATLLSQSRGIACIAGAIVPGKYLRGTPISMREVDEIIAHAQREIPMVFGGWAIRGWRHRGWQPLRKNLFLCLQDTDATLHHFLTNNEWKHKKRKPEQWTSWALNGARSKAVTRHPDLGDERRPGPLTFEVEVYQGCVRYKRGCKFCIEPKKGVPLWRDEHQIIKEVKVALDQGVQHVRLGGMTDTYTYKAEGVVELEYPIPQPKPIETLLYGLREDERLKILHTDNANPSIIAEHLEPAEEITSILVDTLSDGAVLSFGLESADPLVHHQNWLNCDAHQLKQAIRLINRYGKQRGERGLPKLLPGLNFIAGLNGERSETYALNLELLRDLRDEGLWLRRINIRQVEGEGFQKVNKTDFNAFKTTVRAEFDEAGLRDLFPVGHILRDIRWEAHDGRTRLPIHLSEQHRSATCHGQPGVTFGRQIGAYPILIGAEYKIPLETTSDVMITSHGQRSITGIEIGLDSQNITQKQLEAIPGIGKKAAWKLISERAKIASKGHTLDLDRWFEQASIPWQEFYDNILR